MASTHMGAWREVIFRTIPRLPPPGVTLQITRLLIAAALGPATGWSWGPEKSAPGGAGTPPQTVFLLHGMGRSRLSIAVLSWRLRRAGYRTVSVGYDTASRSLDSITAGFLAEIAERSGGGPYHLIGHSLGNIVIRNGFKAGYPPGLGRIVMLAPPNQPPRLAEKFKANPLYRLRTGDSGQKLADPRFYAGLPVPEAEFGVIAGDRGHRFLKERPNDGLLGVENTKLPGMRDFLVLPHTHTFLMNSREVFERCEKFLRTGYF